MQPERWALQFQRNTAWVGFLPQFEKYGCPHFLCYMTVSFELPGEIHELLEFLNSNTQQA